MVLAQDMGTEIVATLVHRPRIPALPKSNSYIDERVISEFISTIQSIQKNSDNIEHVKTVPDNEAHPHVVSLTFTPTIPIGEFHNHHKIKEYESAHEIEVALQPFAICKTPKRLAVFDMDSTLIQQEVIDLLAGVAGVEEQVSQITSRAMNGELDFSESLRERVALLKGLPGDVFEQLKPKLTLTAGADTLLRCLEAMGVKTALLSGGFMPLANYIAQKLSIDHVHANELATAPDPQDSQKLVLTGELSKDNIIVDGTRKRNLLLSIANQYGFSLDQVIAVGDGANDLPMLKTAGLGVAVNAKPKVQEEAPARLNGETALLDVLYLLGVSSSEIDRLSGG